MRKTVPTSEILLAPWTCAARQPVLHNLPVVATRLGPLSLASGLPAPELFSSTLYAQAAAHRSRLNHSQWAVEQTRVGITRLAQIVKQMC